MIHFNRTHSNGCPCHKDCLDRTADPNCHGYCELYLGWKDEQEKINEAERLRHRNNDTMSDAKRKAMWRSKRYSRQLTYNKSHKAD